VVQDGAFLGFGKAQKFEEITCLPAGRGRGFRGDFSIRSGMIQWEG